MLKRFGPLQIFFTISPDSAGTYNIAIKAGHLAEKAVDEANLTLVPNRAERKAIAARYPVECARYFLRVVETVIDVLLGWNRKTGAPKRGGIFGVVRAFGASAETQLAGDLHAHFAVWLHGFPSTSFEFAEALRDDLEYHDRIVQLVDSVLTATPPCLNDEQRCTGCHSDGNLNPVLPVVDAFRRPAPGAIAPTTAICGECHQVFKTSDIIDAP
ncbi:unnamed protein product [Phytophthora lilii]|uniref:Unnamed protein product n=1 Tax=Phytophthora lilii TaxID=2077276 RepID=A0A9W6X449_9STRA|nr:unnamed protein product [Phytophthora lilii]